VPLAIAPLMPVGIFAVQVMVVLGELLLRLTAVEALPEQMVWLAAGENATEGAGFTVMVNICAMPKQPFTSGVTIIVAVTGVMPVFIALNDVILLAPLAASPIDGVLFTQLNVVPITVPTKFIALTGDPLHTV